MSAWREDRVEKPQVGWLVVHSQHGHGDVHHCAGPEVLHVASLAPEIFPVASLAPAIFPVASLPPEIFPVASLSPEIFPVASLAPERNPSIWPGSARTLIGFSTYPSKPARDARSRSSAIAKRGDAPPA